MLVKTRGIVLHSVRYGDTSLIDLSLVNLNYFYKMIPWTDEVSIGHALICDALYMGLKSTIREYLECLK